MSLKVLVLLTVIGVSVSLGSVLTLNRTYNDEWGLGTFKNIQEEDLAMGKAPSEEQTENSTETITITREIDVTQEKDNIEFGYKGPLTVTVDCGSESCFDEKFAACEPATLDAEVGFAATHYEIFEQSEAGCKMLFMYTENPNPDWVDKDMTCFFDNSKSFGEAFEEVFDAVIAKTMTCEGPLADILSSLSD